MHDFFPDRLPVLGDHGRDDRVKNEVFIAHQLSASEGGNAAHEQLSSALEVSHKHAVDALEDLELILLVPVGTLIHKDLALIDVLFEGIDIELLNVHEHDLKEDLHLL